MSQQNGKMYRVFVEGTAVSFAYGDYKHTEKSKCAKIAKKLSSDSDKDIWDKDNWFSLFDRQKKRANKKQARDSKVANHKNYCNNKESIKPREHDININNDNDPKCDASYKSEEKKPLIKNIPMPECNHDSKEKPTHTKVKLTQRHHKDVSSWHEPDEKTDGWNFRRNANRRITRFLSLLCSLKGIEPDLFASLSLPRSMYDKLELNDILTYYKRFLLKLKYHYRRKSMWAIWKIEYSPNSLLHMHLYLKTSNRHPKLSHKNIIKAANIIKQLFAKTIRLKSKKSVKVSQFCKQHYSYLCKKAKRRSEAHLISLLGRKQMFNVINNKNIPVYKDIAFRLTDDEFYKFKKYIINDAINRGLKPDSIKKQFIHKHGHISFIPRQSIARAILYAISDAD